MQLHMLLQAINKQFGHQNEQVYRTLGMLVAEETAKLSSHVISEILTSFCKLRKISSFSSYPFSSHLALSYVF